jgi:signal peptidase I
MTSQGTPEAPETLHGQGLALAEACASLFRLIVIVLFLHTFVLQPFMIPSESMERTLLVGDFLLFNKQVYAPGGRFTSWLLPYREVRRGDIVVFHHPQPKYLVKRVLGLPGDRLRIRDGRVWINGQPLNEPYAVFEPVGPNQTQFNFPARFYDPPNPEVNPEWWEQMRRLTKDDDLVIPAGQYFVLGDNRNHSKDSRYWGFVDRNEIVARPLVIYFSLTEPSTTDAQLAADDRLGHDRDGPGRLIGFARWKRIFQVVR